MLTNFKRWAVISLVSASILACQSNNSGKQNANPQNPGFAQGDMPPGPPPGGAMQQQFDTSLIKGEEIYTSGSKVRTKNKINASGTNESGVVATSSAQLQLSYNDIITSGNTTSNDFSSFQGLNAAVLGRDESIIRMDHNKITTTGTGANAIFAYGKSVIYSENDTIDCTARGGHGIMASGGGTIHAKSISMITRGANSGVIATDRGSGTITVDKAIVIAEGADSPGIYSTGKITVSDAKVIATGAEVAVIEGSNSIICNNCDMKYSFQNKWGVMIYQSFSGDAEGVDGHYEMNNGSLKSEDKTGPLFFVTNSNANIFLNHVAIDNASNILLNASASRWGHEGINGGNAHLNTTNQALSGSIEVDSISSVCLNMSEKSTFTGCINNKHTAKYTEVTLDTTSKWTLTDNCYLNKINCTISKNQVTNIIGNGNNLFYSKRENPDMMGKTYNLEKGGKLLPM